jgi:lipopolysaccharide export system permease protein
MITEKTFFPNIMLKYVAKKYFKTVLATSFVLAGVFMLADSLELSRKLSSKDVADSVIFEMLMLKAPTVYLEILPFAMLIGTLLAFSALAKTSELVAIRSSGVSAWQFLMPSAVIAFVFGIGAILFINPLAASMQKKYEAIEQTIYPDKAHGVIVNGQELWLKYNLEDKMFILHAGSVIDKGRELEDVSIYFYDLANKFIKRIESDNAELIIIGDDYFWYMENAYELVQGKRLATVADVQVPTQMTPEKIQFSFSSPKTISVYDLPEFINSLESAGFSILEHKVRLMSIFFLPLLCVAMFILGAPFALHFSRKGGVGKLLLSGLCFGFVFYMFNSIILTLAQAGRLNIYIAVIIPILIAGLIGLYMLLHFREE